MVTCFGQERSHCRRVQSLTVHEFRELQESQEDFHLLDVREQDEWDFCRLEGARLFPLGDLLERGEADLADIGKNEQVVIYCHHGVRSAHALMFLESIGYTDVWNLTGGIDLWSLQIDPSVRRY